MNNVAHYQSCFNNLVGTDALVSLRQKAIEHFADAGFPTTKDEEWAFTNIAPLTRINFELAASASTPAVLDDYRYGLNGLVFVDGHFAPAHSQLNSLSAGVRVEHLGDAIAANGDLVSESLGRAATTEDAAFTALNTAFLQDGAVVYLPRGAVVEQPIHLLFVSTGQRPNVVSHPRVLVVAEANAQATLVESYVGLDSEPYLTNSVSEFFVGPQRRARPLPGPARIRRGLPHCINSRPRGTRRPIPLDRHHLGRTPDSSPRPHRFRGAKALTPPSTASTSKTGRNTSITTRSSNTPSRTARATSSTRAFSAAEPPASSAAKSTSTKPRKKTDAYQANQNLLLSETAQINTKPQLEIYADDVKCSHGATIGQLDEDALFYLRSRGIGHREAVRVLTRAFAGEVLDRVRVPALKDQLDRLVDSRLDQAAAGVTS